MHLCNFIFEELASGGSEEGKYFHFVLEGNCMKECEILNALQMFHFEAFEI